LPIARDLLLVFELTNECEELGRAQEVCELGWGEPHQFADFGTEIMVYGPRDESEIEIVLGFIGESIAYAREHGLKE
jgi:phospholipase/carboxylesterase